MRVVSILVCWFGLWSAATQLPAQCPGGVCPTPQTPQVSSGAASDSMCRVVVEEDSRTRSVGTGVAISAGPGWSAVLTARHVAMRPGLPAQCVFPNQQVLPGRVAVVCKEYDAAIIQTEGHPAKILNIATEDPQGVIYACGADGQAGWRTWRGRVLRYAASGELIISGVARQGDSGGPVWTEGGLVGLIVATDGQQETVCTSLAQLNQFFTCGRYVFPWNAWLENEKDKRRTPTPIIHVQPPIQQVPTPTVPSDDVAAKLMQLEGRLLVLEGQMKELRGQVDKAMANSKDAKDAADGVEKGMFAKLKSYMIGLTGGQVVLLTLGCVVILILVRRDIRNKLKTGDPLEVQKLLINLAKLTPTSLDDRGVAALNALLDRLVPSPKQETPPPTTTA